VLGVDRHLPGAAMSDRVYLISCVGGHEVDAREHGLLREVTGWAEARKGGGLHHIHFREETGRVMCARCASRRKRGGSIDQGSIW